MALDVGIVGLPGSGKTALFNALTRAAASEHEMKEHVGMAAIADDRLDRLAVVESSAKITPATIRVVDVPGTGPALLGNLRRFLEFDTVPLPIPKAHGIRLEALAHCNREDSRRVQSATQ